MKTNTLTNSEVKKGAKNEAKAINTNPTYVMRKSNKICQGKDTDLKGLKSEGITTDHLKELYKRLIEAFDCGGFWWDSVFARNDYLLTSCRAIEFDPTESDMTPVYDTGDFVWTEMIDGKLYSLKAAAEWNMTNLITSASMMLKFAEARAKASGNLYSWQTARAEAKKKATKKAKKASGLDAAIKQLKKAFKKGEINSVELKAKLAEIAA